MNKKNLAINAAAVEFYKAIDHLGNRSKVAQLAFEALQKLVERHLEKAIFSVFSGPKGGSTAFFEKFSPLMLEALQETYLDLWKKADCKRTRWDQSKVVGDKSASFLTWAQAVAKFKAMDARRRFNHFNSRFPVSLNNLLHRDSAENSDFLEPTSREKSSLENLLINEQGTVLNEAIEKLSDRQRLVIRQIHFKGEKGKEIAKVLGISPTSVSNHLKKGLKKLGSNVDIQALYFDKF